MRSPHPVVARALTLATALSAALSFADRAAAQHHEQPSDPRLAPARAGGLVPPSTAASHAVQFGPFESRQVNIDAAGNDIRGDAANEPSIVVDPTNPDRIAIGWRQFDTTASNFRQNGWAYSHDAGRTWVFPGAIQPGQFNSDPVLDADRQGDLYYLSYPGGRTLNLFRSTDAGLTWSPRAITTGGDKAWMLVDRTTSIGSGNVYLIWQVLHGPDTFARSTDGGLTFTGPFTVPETPTFGTLAVDPNGVVYAAGLRRQNRSRFVLARSTDARDRTRTPTFQTVFVGFGGAMVFGGPPNPGGLLGQAQVVADPTRPNHVYMLCSVDPSGSDPLDVHFVRSTDGGQTFAPPVRVNDDPVGNDAWQWFGTFSIAPDGRLDVVWNDTSRSGDATRCQTRYAFSFDGGLTWSQSVAVGPEWNSVLGHPNQNKIGDYYDMVSDGAQARLAYSTTYNSEQDVYFLEVGDCNRNDVHDAIDIQRGTSFDSNQNTIPDECEFRQQDLGFGSGLRLLVCGDDLTTAQSRATLQVDGGPANSPMIVLISFGRLNPPLPLGGGAALVPDPAQGFPIDTFVTNAHGAFGATIRGGAGRPFTAWIQAAMLDGGGNVLVSNAVEARIGR